MSQLISQLCQLSQVVDFTDKPDVGQLRRCNEYVLRRRRLQPSPIELFLFASDQVALLFFFVSSGDVAMTRSARTAFTLVELLVVIAIIGILIALLLPAVQSAREAARRSQCQNNLKQLGLGVHMYHDSFGRYPYTRSGGGQNRHTWALILLPYIEQSSVFDVYQSDITGVSKTDGMNNHTAANPQIEAARAAQVSAFLCPSRRSGPALSPITAGSTVTGTASDYTACSGDTSTVPTSGIFMLVNSNHMTTPVRINDVLDGTNATLLMGEKHIQFMSLNDSIQDGLIFSGSEQQTYHRRAGTSNLLAISLAVAINTQFGSWHPGVCQFVYADGSVRALRNSTPGAVLAAFANKKDGQAISF